MNCPTRIINVYLPATVGRGYGTFWGCDKRYRVIKGGRASKKSKTAALWLIYNMMKPGYKEANAVVFRKTFRTLKDSCYADLRWAIHRLGVDGAWKATTSPLELTYIKTGQKILFRGLDDPLKIASLTVDRGVLCWAWLEEAYEVVQEEDFNMLDEAIRGEVPAPLFKGWIITFNPWSERHWLKQRFFDAPDADTYTLTTTYKCNEWLDDADKALFERMEKTNPRRYKVSGLGDWGVSEGLVYERWKVEPFDPDTLQDVETVAGLDFGYTHDPSAFFVGLLSRKEKRIYVTSEIYARGLSNAAIYDRITSAGFGKVSIIADSAEPKSIDELRGRGLRIRGAKKGRDSINHGIQWIQDYEIVIHPSCKSFIAEISSYAWERDRFGQNTNRPEDENNHLMDAMRYALEPHMLGRKWIV